jgi:acyl-CoA synthetase (NDP forming)
LDDDVTKMGKAAGCPCVLKVTGEKIVHKSDVGGVIIGIKDEKELLAARAQMEKRLREAGVWDNVEGFFVQEMAAPGKEVILGVTEDPTFGPLIMFGMGGRYVEIVRDVAFRVMPVTDVDAHDMVRSIKSFPLLEGVRGEERVDIEFVEESVQRLAQLVEAVDGIAELDMNPVIVTTDREGCRVVDARIRVASTARAQSVRVT